MRLSDRGVRVVVSEPVVWYRVRDYCDGGGGGDQCLGMSRCVRY